MSGRTLSSTLRTVRWRAEWAFRVATSNRRALPSFLILGAQKSGTSSLAAYLGTHPDVEPALHKEVNFFDTRFERGEQWYRSHFPVGSALRGGRVTFEATPYYLFHPLVPGRVHQMLPDARFVVLLREPVERAFSHYRMERERGREPLSFADAVEHEDERLAPGWALLADGHDPGVEFNRFSYLARGRYAEQLERWFALFGREQFLVVDARRFFAEPSSVWTEVLRFLSLPTDVASPEFRVHREGAPDALEPTLHDRLHELFIEPNATLAALTGIEFDA